MSQFSNACLILNSDKKRGTAKTRNRSRSRPRNVLSKYRNARCVKCSVFSILMRIGCGTVQPTTKRALALLRGWNVSDRFPRARFWNDLAENPSNTRLKNEPA